MNIEPSCPVCSNKSLAAFNTYKHIWFICNQCKNGFRNRKEQYLLDYLPSFLIRLFPILSPLRSNPIVLADYSKQFDNMATTAHTEAHNKMGVFNNFMDDIINKFSLNLNGKRVLDISGGNGDFISKIKGLGADVAMTEFNEASVSFAKNNYKINAVRFDFNCDCISDLFDKRFDVVLLRAALMFCLDIDQFLKDLKKIIKPGSYVIVYCSHPPTPGIFLRHQVQDYLYLRLLQPKKIVSIFNKNQFELIAQEKDVLSSYTDDLTWKLSVLGLFYEALMRFKHPSLDRTVTRDHFIFKLRSDPKK